MLSGIERQLEVVMNLLHVLCQAITERQLKLVKNLLYSIILEQSSC